MSDTTMSKSTLDAFLKHRRVAVLAIARDGKPPLTTPVWYEYDGRRFRIQIDDASVKAKVVRRAGSTPVSLTIQSEVPPYRYAVAYGTATLGGSGDGEFRRRTARHYLGRLAGDMYVAGEEKNGRGMEALRFLEIVPERFVTYDFRPDAGLFGRLYFGVYRWLKPVPA
jgi:hypothetical protein